MTVGKISAACWIVFVAMSVLFLPGLALAADLGDATVPALGTIAAFGVIALWWGPFAYAMYLSLAVMRNGDKRLLARGTRGTAEVLEAERTNTVIQSGEFEWQAPFVYKYRLRISLPGKEPYETTCRICLTGIDEGDTVDVSVSPATATGSRSTRRRSAGTARGPGRRRSGCGAPPRRARATPWRPTSTGCSRRSANSSPAPRLRRRRHPHPRRARRGRRAPTSAWTSSSASATCAIGACSPPRSSRRRRPTSSAGRPSSDRTGRPSAGRSGAIA